MMQEIKNIKERNEKIYILADDNMHKVLKPLKDDIKYLLSLVDKLTDNYYREHRE